MAFAQSVTLLRKLDAHELRSLVVLAQDMLSHPRKDFISPRPRPRLNRRRGLSNKKKTKGPKRPSSVYAKIHEYREFKAADRKLKAFLKQSGAKLRDFSPDDPEKVLPEIVAGFYEARNCWFRRKASLNDKPDAEASSSVTEEKETGAPKSGGD